MTHDSYREMIQRELDGDLSSTEIVLLEEHVATCADCRQEREQFSSLASVFGKIGHVKPDRSFVPQMVPELPQFVAKKRRFPTQAWWRGLSVAAVMVLAVGVSTDWKFGIGTQLLPNGQHIASVQEESPSPEPTAELSKKEAPQQILQTPSQSNEVGIASVANQSEPKLIAQETVKKKTTVKAIAASSGDVAKVESQTGVKVDPNSAATAGDATATAPSEVVVAAIDSEATDVIVDGNNVTVVLTPVEKNSGSDSSEVSVYGIAAVTPGTNTVTFTDPSGNVISQTEVDVPPADSIIGKKTSLNRVLNEQVQQQAKKSSDQAWTTDSYQVVKRYLTDLGFAANAEVVSTNHAEVVHVVQGGIQYEVLLEQPYDKGAEGIWRPVQISRQVKASTPQSFEKPMVKYFDDLRSAGKIAEFDLYVMGPLTGNKVTLSASLTKKDASGRLLVEQAVYEFTLKQGADGEWQSAGQPTVRK